MAATDDTFERTVASMMRTMLLVAAIGLVVALSRGWTYGAGFAVGAALSWVNFWWLKGFVAGLGPGGKPSGFAFFFVVRYLLLGGVAYVILRYSKLSLPAMFVGLFVALAAATIAAIIQYARRDLDH
jgi:FtsH-binding integral membrane protein